MRLKIDTKEKFHVITFKEPKLAANMTAELGECLLPYLKNDVKNLVVNLEDIQMLDDAAGQALVKIQQTFYAAHASFVVCGIRPDVENRLEKAGLLELMNWTPTVSEGGDIVQMEEIERELLGGEE